MKRSTFEIWKSPSTSRWHWRLRSPNGEVVCSGQPRGYQTRVGAGKGIAAVRRTALFAKVTHR
jgi:uncharacterized protein YegP (UPF0339 family)